MGAPWGICRGLSVSGSQWDFPFHQPCSLRSPSRVAPETTSSVSPPTCMNVHCRMADLQVVQHTGSRPARRGPSSVLPLSVCMTSGKLLNLWVSPFPCLLSEDGNTSHTRSLRILSDGGMKKLVPCLPHRRHQGLFTVAVGGGLAAARSICVYAGALQSAWVPPQALLRRPWCS